MDRPESPAARRVPAAVQPSDAAPIRYHVEINGDDYLSARRLSLRPRRALRRVFWILGVPFVAVLALDLYHGVARGRPHPFLAAILGAATFLVVWYYVLLPAQVRRAYRPINDTSTSTIAGELSERGVTVTANSMRGQLAWTDVAKWKRNGRLILLYSTGGEFTMIPLRGFAGATDRSAALALLEQHLGPAEK